MQLGQARAGTAARGLGWAGEALGGVFHRSIGNRCGKMRSGVGALQTFSCKYSITGEGRDWSERKRSSHLGETIG